MKKLSGNHDPRDSKRSLSRSLPCLTASAVIARHFCGLSTAVVFWWLFAVTPDASCDPQAALREFLHSVYFHICHLCHISTAAKPVMQITSQYRTMSTMKMRIFQHFDLRTGVLKFCQIDELLSILWFSRAKKIMCFDKLFNSYNRVI